MRGLSGRRLRTRYPIWDARFIGLLALLVVVLATVLVFVISKRPLFVETELSLLIIALSLFLFLSIGLYRGVRVRREALELPSLSMPRGGSDRSGWADALDLPVDLVDVGDAESCLGAILGVILSIVVAIALVLLFWLLVGFVWGAVAVLLVALFWIFNRALRIVFARSRLCRGNLSLSLLYASAYTLLYTGWLFGLAYAAHWLVQHRGRG